MRAALQRLVAARARCSSMGCSRAAGSMQAQPSRGLHIKAKLNPRILFLGAPGVGKGTFAARVAPALGVPTISTGDLVRAEIKSESKLGRHIKELNAKGNLVPDELITDMAKQRLALADASNGFILDGFPRTVRQAEALEGFSSIDLALNLELAEKLLVLKMISRRVCSNCGTGYNLAAFNDGDVHMEPLLPKVEGKCDKCGHALVQRADDTEAVAQNRLQIHNRETQPIIDFYAARSKLYRFQVKRGVEDVPRLLKELTESLTSKKLMIDVAEVATA